MKKWVIIGLALLALPVRAAPAEHVVISEIQTATTASVSQEFVELYNPSAAAISVEGWTLEYKAATSSDVATSWGKHATLHGSIAAHGYWLAAPSDYLAAANDSWSPGLAGSAGHVRLRDASGTEIDRLGYGSTANAAEGAPAPAPVAGGSLERKPGAEGPPAGNGVDTGNNANDFGLRAVAEPQASSSVTEPFLEPPVTVADVDDGSLAPLPLAPFTIELTELLPDPAAPLSDTSDEFIELHNYGEVSVDLTGAELRTGSDGRYRYKLPALSLDPGQYYAVYSKDTKLTLTNGGSLVELVAPGGQAVSSTSYATATTGSSWSLIGGVWQWSATPTPDGANVLSASSAATTAAAAAAKAKKTAAAAKPKAATKAAAKPKAPAKKAAAKKATKSTSFNAGAIVPTFNLAGWLLIALACLTIGYAIYEFRHDIYDHYHRLRGYRGVRPALGPEPAGERALGADR